VEAIGGGLEGGIRGDLTGADNPGPVATVGSLDGGISQAIGQMPAARHWVQTLEQFATMVAFGTPWMTSWVPIRHDHGIRPAGEDLREVSRDDLIGAEGAGGEVQDGTVRLEVPLAAAEPPGRDGVAVAIEAVKIVGILLRAGVAHDGDRLDHGPLPPREGPGGLAVDLVVGNAAGRGLDVVSEGAEGNP
jgi:hypothetical protein